MSSFNTPPAERLGGAPAAKSAAKRDVAVSAGAVQTPATVGAESARRLLARRRSDRLDGSSSFLLKLDMCQLPPQT